MVIAILRDSFFGWCCRFVTGGRVFKYPEEVHPTIWQHYLADDDPYLSTIGLAVTSPVVPSLPPKNPRRNSPPQNLSFYQDSFLAEEYQHLRQSQHPPLPPDPPEEIWARRSRRPSEESVGRSVWLNSKPSAATLVPEGSYHANTAETVRLDSFGTQATHRLHETLRSAPKAARLSNSRSADTLVSPGRDRETAYPPISPRSSSKKAANTSIDRNTASLRDPPVHKRNDAAVSTADNCVRQIQFMPKLPALDFMLTSWAIENQQQEVDICKKILHRLRNTQIHIMYDLCWI